jgi:hypothetical protein
MAARKCMAECLLRVVHTHWRPLVAHARPSWDVVREGRLREFVFFRALVMDTDG